MEEAAPRLLRMGGCCLAPDEPEPEEEEEEEEEAEVEPAAPDPDNCVKEDVKSQLLDPLYLI